MHHVSVVLRPGADLEGFRRAVRSLVAQGVAPDRVSWSPDGEMVLFGDDLKGEAPPVDLPRDLACAIGDAVCHCDCERYALL